MKNFRQLQRQRRILKEQELQELQKSQHSSIDWDAAYVDIDHPLSTAVSGTSWDPDTSDPLTQSFRHKTEVTHVDRPLMFTTLGLAGFGLLAVYTASANHALDATGNSFLYVGKQAFFMMVGLVGMWLFSRCNFQVWKRLAYPLAGVTLLLLVMTLTMGKIANGSERWLVLPGGIQFQPSEFAKLSVVSLMAIGLTRKSFWNPLLIFNLLVIGAMVMLVQLQPNLSMVIILSVMTVMMLFVGGFPLPVFLAVAPVGAVGLYHKIMNTEYLRRRIEGWLDPWADPMDTGYNLIQSYYAIGNGGIFGKGLGHSVQKLYYLPFQHTDFIFAVICEELGTFGSLSVVGLFALLAWRGFSIAFFCPSPFGQLLAFGITASIVLQAAINLCVTTGLMPVTGVTLPLISYGGTSAVLTLCMIGILLNISRYRLRTEPAAAGQEPGSPSGR